MTYPRVAAILCLGLCIFSSSFSWAGGMPVTDPTSYTYSAQLLLKELEQIEQQVENIEEVKKVYEESKKIYDSMNSVYTEVKQYYDKYKQIRDRIAGTISSVEAYYYKYKGEAEDIEAYLNDNGFIDVQKVLDDTFKDIRNPSNDTTIFDEWPKRRALIERATREAIVEAEEITQALPGEMDRQIGRAHV